ncbi:MAG TPA: response regulator transcription factor [Solirubrobacteraceae bacterium]|jgi:two-component system response regulator NreC
MSINAQVSSSVVQAVTDPPVHVVLADDHALLRRGLRRLLAAHSDDIKVVAEAESLASIARDLRGRDAHVLVLDLTIPYGGSIEVITQLRRRTARTQIVVLTTSDDPNFVQGALTAGAMGVVLKQFADRDLAPAIRAAAVNERYVSPLLASRLSGFHRTLPDEPLTPREVEVLRLIALGYTSVEIANTLGLSPRTIESHRARMHRTLALTTRAELVHYALRRGLLSI